MAPSSQELEHPQNPGRFSCNAHASVSLLDEPNDLLAVYLLLRIALPLGCTDSSTLPWYGLQVAGCRSSACHTIFSALVAFAYTNASDKSSHIE
jgi:hypothetical protein